MKLFGSFKLTDRIRIGASSGGGKKSSKGIGCGSIFLVLCLICIPISLVRSCINGDEETTTELTTVVEEKEDTTESEETTEQETSTKEKTTPAPTTVRKETTTNKPTTTAKPFAEKKEYVLNTNTKKIHNSGCSSVEDIEPQNRSSTKDFDSAIADGYLPCGRCHPTGD